MDFNVIMKHKQVLITGGAGFIGSHLVSSFLSRNINVKVIDNFSTGSKQNLDMKNPKLEIFECDLLEQLPSKPFEDVDCVFHFAANADIRDGMSHTSKDINQNIVATERLLSHAMKYDIKDFIFASTAAALGEPDIFPTPEDLPLPRQTSLYGMSKLAAEGVFSAYTEAFGLRVSCFRFVSVVGEYYSHGHVIDFVKKLKDNPNKLEILGDGNQKKSYLHVHDIITGIDCVLAKCHNHDNSFFEVYHIGNKEYCTVSESALAICKELQVSPNFIYTGGTRGWVGDSPFVHLDTSKITKLGWRPEINILDAIRLTAKWLQDKV